METPILTPMDMNSSVYEPAEDSFLLLDALELDLDTFLTSRSQDPILVLEVGCGSGILSTSIAKVLKDKNSYAPCVFSIDINPEATLLTKTNALLNGLDDFIIQPILLDGPNSAPKCFREPFDLIVCNPPYVPIQPGENSEDSKSGLLEKSWSGGPDGNEFITPFLSNVGQMLRLDGVLYLLLSSWNNPDWLNDEIAKSNGLQGTLLIKRTAGRERLSIWKFVKIA
ncbi:methyltransferase N6AMT1-like [Folsomia candida]|uniref:methyltransferase N6AMT1-like n=1 Tax=Folsomia candida TaxID=158441 RepID=UPI000B8F0FB5|nr:methyltransferase N6AMT1-like [Folsomia candida]